MPELFPTLARFEKLLSFDPELNAEFDATADDEDYLSMDELDDRLDD